MTSRRLLKAAEAIREVVSTCIVTELRDPRIRDVTVTYVEVAADMRSAKVHVSIMGNEARQNLSLTALQHAAGYLQQRIADRIITRYVPKLQFVLDKGVKNSAVVSRILREVLPPQPAAEVGPQEQPTTRAGLPQGTSVDEDFDEEPDAESAP
jgi:ribosome-binding factor A